MSDRLSELVVDMFHRRSNRWSNVDQTMMGHAVWALRRLEELEGKVLYRISRSDKGQPIEGITYDNMVAFLTDEGILIQVFPEGDSNE